MRFLEMANLISSWSKCNKLKVGAVLVRDKRIIATGFNGLGEGIEGDCECDGVTKDSVIHAEQNILLQCAKYGIDCRDTILFCTHGPCVRCESMIFQAGIKHVYYTNSYKRTEGFKMTKYETSIT